MLRKMLKMSQKGKGSLRVRGSAERCHFTARVGQRGLLNSGLEFHVFPYGAEREGDRRLVLTFSE